MRIVGLRLALSFVWLLLVCYPDPRILAEAIGHAWSPPIDAAAVLEWARELPDHPVHIEEAVIERVRYAVPWQTHGAPWAFPSPAAVLAMNLGDCQSRAVVLASVLQAKGIPFELRASVDHMWVEYAGKPARALERADGMLWSRRSSEWSRSGDFLPESHFQLPKIDWSETLRLEREYYWDAAPVSRRLLLIGGLLLVWLPVGRALAPSTRLLPAAWLPRSTCTTLKPSAR